MKPQRIRLALAHDRVRASDPQVITVTNLAPRERVTIRYRGNVIATLSATTRGTLTHRFKAHTTWGTHTVAVRAHRTHRVARTTFDVGRRCADGVWGCP